MSTETLSPPTDRTEQDVVSLERLNPATVHEIGTEAVGQVAEVPNPYEHLTTPLPHDKEGLKQALGVDSDEQLEGLAWMAEQARDSTRITVNRRTRRLDDILTSGRLISAVEKGEGTSPSRGDHEQRRGMVQEDEQPLIYGYLRDPSNSEYEHRNAGAYGGLTITLKPEVIGRSTFTDGDSMVGRHEMRSFDDALLLEQRRLQVEQTSQKIGGYTEAQIHEGVTLADVESISVPISQEITKDESSEAGAIENVIAKLETSLTDAHKTIAIDATESIHDAANILEITKQHPNVDFEFVVASHAPPVHEATAHIQDVNGNEELEMIVTEQADKRTRTDEQLRARYEAVSQGLAGRIGDEHGKLPANIRVVMTHGDTRFVR